MPVRIGASHPATPTWTPSRSSRRTRARGRRRPCRRQARAAAGSPRRAACAGGTSPSRRSPRRPAAPGGARARPGPRSWAATARRRGAGGREHDGALARHLGGQRDAGGHLHVGRAQLDAGVDAASWTPERACTAERVEATRETDCSWASRSALAVESFTMKTSEGKGSGVIEAVDMWTAAETTRGCGVFAHKSRRSLSTPPVKPPRRRARRSAAR
jgi:hypothetical protein